MKKLLILFLFLLMFVCSKEGYSVGAPPTLAPISAIVVQCPCCYISYSVYGSGTYRCSNCGNYFQVGPGPVYTPPPVIITQPQPVHIPPPVIITPQPVYTPPPVFYYNWGYDLNIFFGYRPYYRPYHRHRFCP